MLAAAGVGHGARERQDELLDLIALNRAVRDQRAGWPQDDLRETTTADVPLAGLMRAICGHLNSVPRENEVWFTASMPKNFVEDFMAGRVRVLVKGPGWSREVDAREFTKGAAISGAILTRHLRTRRAAGVQQ